MAGFLKRWPPSQSRRLVSSSLIAPGEARGSSALENVVAAPRCALPLAAASIGWVHLADAGEMPSSTSTAATPRAAHDALAGALTGCRALLTLTPSQRAGSRGPWQRSERGRPWMRNAQFLWRSQFLTLIALGSAAIPAHARTLAGVWLRGACMQRRAPVRGSHSAGAA